MSKSIKQYKDAMDNIKISESFAKRTETLLKEAGAGESVSLSGGNGGGIRKITFAAGLGLAACIAAAMILKPSTGNISQIEHGIQSESVNITAVTSVKDITVSVQASEDETVYVDIEEDSTEYIRSNDPAVEILEENYYESIPASAAASESGAAPSDTAPLAPQENSEKTPADSAGSASDIIFPAFETGLSEEPEIEKRNSERHYTGEDIANDDEDLFEADEAAGDAGHGEATEGDSGSLVSSGSGSGLYYIDYSSANAELVSYVNGEGSAAVTLDNESARYIISSAAYAVNSVKETDVNNAFISEFVLLVTEKSSEKPLYTVYVTTDKTIVITDHTGIRQIRKTYIPDENDFLEIEKSMYLFFGDENDYNYFMYEKLS